MEHIAGPAEEVRELVKQLEAENIFARALDTNGVPYHSSVLQPLLPELDRCKPLFPHLCIASLKSLNLTWQHLPLYFYPFSHQ